MTEVEINHLFANNSPTLMVNVSCDSGIREVKVWSKWGRVPMILKPPTCPGTLHHLLVPYPADWLPVTVDVLCCCEGAAWQRFGPYQQDGTLAQGNVGKDAGKPPGAFQPTPPKVPGEHTNGKDD